MGSNKFEAFCRLFTYIKNKRGPNIDPWGTPHTTSFKFVFFNIAHMNVLFSVY